MPALTLRDLTDAVPALGWVCQRLELLSGPGRRVLHALPWLTDAGQINASLDRVEQLMGRDATEMGHVLMQVRDIAGTIDRLGRGQVMDDIELFELKSLALLAGRMDRALRGQGIQAFPLPDLEPAVELLDPEGTRMPHFYIYDAYDPRLRPLRRSADPESVYDRIADLEDAVRTRLSKRLRPLAPKLEEALDTLARIDVALAQARLAAELKLTRPAIGSETSYRGLFHPVVSQALESQGGRYQKVDVEATRGCTVITGANMAGKSLTLKTLGLAQTLAQLGMHVPAEQARVALVERILVSMGDDQDERQGLSSFAAEMLRIDSILRTCESEPSLVLVDEPARTTNPDEGAALVDALCARLQASPSRCVVTTHYGGLGAPCRRLRVRGFTQPVLEGTLTPRDVGRCMDYTLVADDGAQPPREALRIARLLGVDADLLDHAQSLLRKQPKNPTYLHITQCNKAN